MASDSAYNKYKAYIVQIHQKVKEKLVYVPSTIEGLKEELQCTERKLGLFLELLEEVGKESYSDTSRSIEGEEESASRSSSSDDEVDFAIKISQFDDDNLYDLSSLQKLNKEINSWFRTQLHDFTRAASSLGGLGSASQSLEAKSISQDIEEEGGGDKRMRRVGLEVDVQNLSRTLIHDAHNKLILIVGEKGLGKSTLAMEVYQNNIVAHHFQVCAWVNLSRSFVRREVLQNILKDIPQQFLAEEEVDYSMASTRELAAVLGNISINTRCLIVLDGLRTPKAWKELREILPLRFCRIMITTRYRDLEKVGVSSGHIVHEMRALSDQEGWELFKTKVHVPARLEQLGKKIVRKCVGLPLEILTIGDLLSRRDATEEIWLTALHEYVNPRHKLVFELNAAAENLQANLKECLSCLELFNEEYDIPMRRLIVYWVAEGLVKQENGSSEAPEVIAERYLMDFIKLNFIQAAKWKLNGKLKTCRMNYFLRNTWLEKAKKGNIVADNKQKLAHHKSFATTHQILLFGIHLKFHDNKMKKSSTNTGKLLRLADNLNPKDKSFSHIHGLDNNISSSSYRQYYGDLCTFVSFDTREGPVPGEDVGKFLRGCIAARCFNNLRIIDLEGTFRPKLPDTIGELIQLRYLGLRHTYLELLPSSIGKLLNLQTLDLKHSCVKTIPCSIWKLQKLRHLYLSENYRSKIMAPASTSSLVKMQTLWGAFVDEEANIANSLHSSIKIRKLGLAYQLTLPQQKIFAEWISKLKHLESLRLRSIDDMVCPSDLYLKPLSGLNKLSSIYLLGRLDSPLIVREFPLSLTEITLSISGLSEDPMPSFEKLPNLRILKLYAGSYTGKIMVCSSGGFPLLRVLNLWKLEELEDWIVEDGALPILRDLEIRSCKNLKMVPEGLKHLRHCNELKLTYMSDEFEARVAANQGQDWQKIAHIPSVVTKNCKSHQVFPSSSG